MTICVNITFYFLCTSLGNLDNSQDYSAIISSDGSVALMYPVAIETTCPINVRYFPWDEQVCPLKFGSWSYDGASVDIVNATAYGDISEYAENGEWNLVGKTLNFII